MSLSEAPHLEALKRYLESPKLPTAHEAHWGGKFDSLTISLLHLFTHDQIDREQAEAVLGPDFNLALWERFGDLAQAFSTSTGNTARDIWREFAALSEKVAGPDPRKKFYQSDHKV